MALNLNLDRLDHNFGDLPLLIGGKAMEYYGLRVSGADTDLVVSHSDHAALFQRYPEHVKDLHGDIGICEFGFEIWNTICRFDYGYLSQGANLVDDVLVIALDKLLFLKALAMGQEKYLRDCHLIVEEILKRQYS